MISTSADRSEAIYAAIKAMPRQRKIVYSAAAVVPIAAAAYGFHGLLGTCPRSPDRNVFLGLFMAGAIFSLLSLAWFLLLCPTVLRAHERLRRATGPAYILVLLAVVFTTKPIFQLIGQNMEASEHTRCHLAPARPVGRAAGSRVGWL